MDRIIEQMFAEIASALETFVRERTNDLAGDSSERQYLQVCLAKALDRERFECKASQRQAIEELIETCRSMIHATSESLVANGHAKDSALAAMKLVDLLCRNLKAKTRKQLFWRNAGLITSGFTAVGVALYIIRRIKETKNVV